MEEINEIKEDKNNKNNLNKNNEEIFENILNIVHNLEKNIQDNYLNQQTTNNDIKEEITNNKRIIDKINEEIIKMNNEEYRKIIDYHLFNINNKQKKHEKDMKIIQESLSRSFTEDDCFKIIKDQMRECNDFLKMYKEKRNTKK